MAETTSWGRLARQRLPRTGRAYTKIVATIGPASDPPDVLRALFEAGADVARLGLAHGPIEASLDRIDRKSVV